VSYDILWYDEIGSVRMVERGREISTIGSMRNLETDSRIILLICILALCPVVLCHVPHCSLSLIILYTSLH
jgi:hypothetical protein